MASSEGRMSDGATAKKIGRLPAWTLAAAFAQLVLCGCQKIVEDIPPPQPVVDGDRITFPKDGRQATLLKSVSADAYFATTASVPGRLAWNEERTSRVFSPVAGRVVALSAAPGSAVKRGSALASISSPDIGAAQAERRKSETDLTLAQKNVTRAQELFSAGVIPEKDLQVSQAELARAQAERDRTQAREKLYGHSKSGAVDQQFVLTSPIPGVVVERNLNPGQEVRPDQAQPGAPPLFVITDPTVLWAQLELPESLLGTVEKGKVVALHANAYPEEKFTATVQFVADAIDPASRTVKARALVANPERRLKAEMFVNADVAQTVEPAPKVPASAVILIGDKQFVFIDKGELNYERRQVTADEVRLGTMRIRSGVHAGEKVVVEGSLLLQQLLAARKSQ
jgi:cobalt-zinc-cadmium efflux system membrane fusion protein